MNVEAEQQDQRVWKPNSGPQTDFLASCAYEAMYGGAAGGGKTQALVLGALRYIGVPKYNAIIFRRTFPELSGEVIPLSHEWYPYCGGRYNNVNHVWRFPSGARIHFGHLQHDADVHRYQGWQFQYIGFDELTTFTEHQYRYMRSRLRSPGGLIPVRVRSGTNPGGEGHEWVFKRFAPWLDPESPVKGEPCKMLWGVEEEDVTRWVSADGARAVNEAYASATDIERESLPIARLRAFFPARLSDNPSLARTEYGADLNSLDALTRAQLKDGNWLIKPSAGLLFRRGWFRIVEAAPLQVTMRVRRWDLASTEGGGDWTVGVRLSRSPSGWCIEDVVRIRARPSEVQATVKTTADMDGHGVRIEIPQDPGQAGKDQCEAYARLLAGFNIRFPRETGDKVTRAQPASAQCEAQNVTLVKARWNEPFLQALEAFPDPTMHDDDVDAFSGAFNATITLPAGFSSLADVSSARRL